MTDMYNPTTGGHYMASPSQVAVLEKYGWLPYSVWLAQQNTTSSSTTSSTTTSDSTTTPTP